MSHCKFERESLLSCVSQLQIAHLVYVLWRRLEESFVCDCSRRCRCTIVCMCSAYRAKIITYAMDLTLSSVARLGETTFFTSACRPSARFFGFPAQEAM